MHSRGAHPEPPCSGDLHTLARAIQRARTARIGQLAVRGGVLSNADVLSVLDRQSADALRGARRPFGQTACQLGCLAPESLASLLAEQCALVPSLSSVLDDLRALEGDLLSLQQPQPA